jgi:hypothetical protein
MHSVAEQLVAVSPEIDLVDLSRLVADIGARREWYPAPANLREKIAEAMERISQVENQMKGEGLAGLMPELFPEAGELDRALPRPDGILAKLKSLLTLRSTTAATLPSAARLEQSVSPYALRLIRRRRAS